MSGLVDRASRQSVEVVGEPSRDLRKEVGRKQAVVVGESDEIRADFFERSVAGTGKPSFGAQPDDVESSLPQDRFESIVLVLIDYEHAKGAVGLHLQRVKEPLELADAVDGRDDEVE